MIINLPHINPIDTFNLPEDFEKQIKHSFSKFTECTSQEYRDEDKLMYLDNLRTKYLHNYSAANEVKSMITDCVEYELDEDGEYPDKEEFWSFDFMCECYERGQKDGNFRNNYEKAHRKNDTVIKVIAQIIRIIMTWSEEDSLEVE